MNPCRILWRILEGFYEEFPVFSVKDPLDFLEGLFEVSSWVLWRIPEGFCLVFSKDWIIGHCLSKTK